MPAIREKIIERFMKYVITSEDSGVECWIWAGALDGNGYGAWKLGEFKSGAHRSSYKLFRGSIPAGLCVRHTCDIHICVNPQHLLLGTYKDNMRDAMERGLWHDPTPISKEMGISYRFNKQLFTGLTLGVV